MHEAGRKRKEIETSKASGCDYNVAIRETMTTAQFRKLALALPEATEGSHFGNPDFRIGGKIFATLALAKQGYSTLLLSREEQFNLIADASEYFSAVPGGWGKKGATRVLLAKVPRDILQAALHTAWRRKAPKRLLARHMPS